MLTLAAGLSSGPRAAAATSLGCTLGIVPHMAAALTGLAALLHASALAFDVLKYAGVVYLLYVAWASLQADGPLAIGPQAAAKTHSQWIGHALWANVLNPKLSIFFLAFLPQFVDTTSSQPAAAMIRLSLVFMALTFAVFALYGVFAAQMRDRVLQRPAVLRWLRRSFAAAFVLLGARLAWTQR